MRGVWRAWIAALGLGLIPVAIVLLTGQSRSVAAGIVLTGILAALPGLAALKPTWEAEQFIRGMRRSAGRIHVVSDELDWALRRKLILETPVGTWRVEGNVNPFRHGIVVKPPRTHGSYHVRESPDEAGRVLMARVLTAQPAYEERTRVQPEPDHQSGRHRSARI